MVADYDLVADQLANPRLADGTPLAADEFLQLALEAEILPALFDTDGQPLWLGRAYRDATTAQRIALAVRDKGCVGCGMANSFCEPHHIDYWDNGGPTDIDNLCLLCGHCHHKEIHSKRGADHRSANPTANTPCNAPTTNPTTSTNPSAADHPHPRPTPEERVHGSGTVPWRASAADRRNPANATTASPRFGNSIGEPPLLTAETRPMPPGWSAVLEQRIGEPPPPTAADPANATTASRWFGNGASANLRR